MIKDMIFEASILAVIGGVFGFGLAYASKKFAVKVDERINKIKEVLPGANCGACGYPGCEGYASAIVSGEAGIGKCTVGGIPVANAISEVMNVTADEHTALTARVMCNGKCNASREKYNYAGINNCTAAAQLFSGSKQCNYGCLGYGTCMDVCKFDAIVISDGIAKILRDKCVGCGKCVQACPKNLIQLVPSNGKYSVLCKSNDKGAVAKANCDFGCIGCTKCQKVCPNDAITIENNLAKIDAEKCTNCGECERVCPVKAIQRIE